MSNTDKLQEIKERWDEGKGLISTDAIEYLISQLEQSQSEHEQLKQLNEEITKYINKLVKENEQLKADKQKLVKAMNTILRVKYDGSIPDEWDGSTVGSGHGEIRKIARQVLSEVKGNG